jgi:putative component of toxin-antitoxin plasmid stabilization module
VVFASSEAIPEAVLELLRDEDRRRRVSEAALRMSHLLLDSVEPLREALLELRIETSDASL